MRKIKNVWINNIRWYTIILEMVTEEKKENIIGNEGEKIRCQFDEQKTLWYFSIVDVIEIFANSTDARNYWKVLKNRLKKADLELVTKINQLKMKARDGKLYMTDTADQELMVRILFELIFHQFLKQAVSLLICVNHLLSFLLLVQSALS